MEYSDREIQECVTIINNHESKPKQVKNARIKLDKMLEEKYKCDNYSQYGKYHKNFSFCKTCDKAKECEAEKLKRLKQKEIERIQFFGV